MLANEAGRKKHANLLPLLSPIDPKRAAEGVPLQEILAGLIETGKPVHVAVEAGLVRLTPMVDGSGLVQGAVLEWRQEAHEEKLHILQEVSRAVNSSLILEDIFEALGDVLRRYIAYREAVIVILDDSQNGIKTLVRIDRDGALDISGENNMFAGYDPVVDRILKQPKSYLYDRDTLPESVVLDQEAAAGIVVPLINKGMVIGLIAMTTDTEGGLYHYQEALLSEVSSQLAVAVENAKFYWQTQAQASRAFLINQLTTAIRQSLEIDAILSTAAGELGRVMGVSRCFIRYFGEEDKRYAYSIPGTPAMAVTDEAFEQKVFDLRRDQPYNPFVLNDVRDCPPTVADGNYFGRNGIKSLAVLPILVREKLVGAVTLHQCNAYRAWVSEDIELLRAIAEHLGVALNQAELFMTLDRQKQELEQTLAELQQAQLYLIQSEKMAVLGQFVAGIAHEVNTPLGTIISNNNTLQSCLKRLGENTGEPERPLLETANELLELNRLASGRIREIVKNLRNFARLDESERKTVNIHEGINSTLLVMQSAIPKNMIIEKRYNESIPLLKCYPGLLNQVFMNIIVNAVHAMDGMATGTITIETGHDAGNDRVWVAIADTGKGIGKEYMARIFDPGFTTKGVGVGTGLGLALCYRIVEKHGGQIRVESRTGKDDHGTRFTVEIPRNGTQAGIG